MIQVTKTQLHSDEIFINLVQTRFCFEMSLGAVHKKQPDTDRHGLVQIKLLFFDILNGSSRLFQLKNCTCISAMTFFTLKNNVKRGGL